MPVPLQVTAAEDAGVTVPSFGFAAKLTSASSALVETSAQAAMIRGLKKPDLEAGVLRMGVGWVVDAGYAGGGTQQGSNDERVTSSSNRAVG